MHEMSIAQSIVELAEEQARSRHSEAVEELELEIGHVYRLRADFPDGDSVHALPGMRFLLC